MRIMINYIKPYILILLILMLMVNGLFSQDIHFSQFWNSPINLNPAHTGQFEGDYRLVMNNKNQWLSFANAYSTFTGSVDAGFENFLIKNTKSGIGLQMNNDIAGDGRLSTNQFLLSASFSGYLNPEKTLNISIGFNAGYTYNAVNFENFRFGSQYQFDRYDPDADHYETWQYDRVDYFSYNTGFNISFVVDTGFNISFGAAAFNLNQPGKSFSENADFYLPIRYAYNIQSEYHIKDDLWIEPYFLFMHQQKYKEILAGGLLRFDYNPLTFRSFYMGALFRASDAGIFLIGAEYQNVKLSISYDVNVSKLTRISRGRGGIEFSLIYIFMKPVPFATPYYRKCPDFM